MLQCNATGEYYPPDEMDWFRNGERLSSQRHRGVRISKQYSISKRTFTSVLVINRASMDDDGTYVCRSSNMQITSTKVHVLNGKLLLQYISLLLVAIQLLLIKQRLYFNPVALRKAKIAHNFGLSKCNRVNIPLLQ